MLPILQIGPFAIQLPGLLLLLGLWLGLTLAERNATRHSLDASTLYNLFIRVLIAGLLGARLTYVVRFPHIFLQSPISILSLNPGLLDVWGGITAGIIVGFIYGRRKKLALWSTLDAVTPTLAVLSVASALSNLASGEAYGAPTNLPWGVELWGVYRHPSQIYEAIAAILILYLTWPGKERLIVTQPGKIFFNFIALTSGAALFLYRFRGDSVLFLGGIRQEQVLAWLILAGSLWIKNSSLLSPKIDEGNSQS